MVLKGTVPQRMAANCRLTCHISVMADIPPSPESTAARLGARAAGPACRSRAAVASMASRRLVRAPSQTPLQPHPYYVTTGLRLSDATAGPDRAQLDLLCPPTRAGGQRCGGAPSSRHAARARAASVTAVTLMCQWRVRILMHGSLILQLSIDDQTSRVQFNTGVCRVVQIQRS